MIAIAKSSPRLQRPSRRNRTSIGGIASLACCRPSVGTRDVLSEPTGGGAHWTQYKKLWLAPLWLTRIGQAR